jgi:hypothetical protein
MKIELVKKAPFADIVCTTRLKVTGSKCECIDLLHQALKIAEEIEEKDTFKQSVASALEIRRRA